MTPIETEYKGYRFRSRLEARWAVFFDACNVKWEYEPEGFDLGDGLYYLPDFLLHDVLIRNHNIPDDLWVEVKGRMTKMDAKKIEAFAYTRRWIEDVESEEGGFWYPLTSILVVTNIPEGDCFCDLTDYMQELAYSDDFSLEVAPYNFTTIDGDYFAAYPVINKQGRLVIEDDNGRCAGERDTEATEEAYRLARQARFEHNKKVLQNVDTRQIRQCDK